MNNQNVIANANALFRQGKYKEALPLYEKAVESYGFGVIKYNIEKCRRNIGIESVSSNSFDMVTDYLLLSAAGIADVDAKRQSLIEKIRKIQQQKSEDAEIKTVNTIPADWPKDLALAPLPESTNDYEWAIKRRDKVKSHLGKPGLSIIVPTYNRSNILAVTLACLCNQITNFKFEVIVADDGSGEDISSVVRKFENKLDIKHVRHKDDGYRLCAIRNFGIRSALYDWVAILDCDMAPNLGWVESYCVLLEEYDGRALIGPRKYIDTNNCDYQEFLDNPGKLMNLPEVRTNNSVAGLSAGEISVDWRLKIFSETQNLRLCDEPFRYFSGGNVAFSKKWIDKAGWFDEDFAAWGGEDNEFGYRLYRAGCFFQSVNGALAYHQEPPGKENETNRELGHQITKSLMMDRVPFFYRKIEKLEIFCIKKVPLVSIYIPAYNCKQYIERCIDSALYQTIPDLEVCVCDDGSNDGTSDLLRMRYGNNPRVKIVKQENGGIGRASNTAVNLCRGYYIGQLDSDDYLNPDAVEICLREFMKDRKLACVYTTNRNIDLRDDSAKPGYNWPVYSREKLSTAMIAHHFRMFTARAWNLTSGFDEKITNAVDYDMYLKLSEVGHFKHVNKICYNRVIHGNNTSVKKLMAQKENHFLVVQNSLKRQRVDGYLYSPRNPEDDACRKYEFVKNSVI